MAAGAPPPLPICVLVSGLGSTLAGLLERIRSGTLPVRIVLVVSDRPSAPAIEVARAAGVPFRALPRARADPGEWARELGTLVAAAGPEVLVLAGFLSILPAEFLERFAGRVLNLHPALLPAHGGPGMYGDRVHRAVLAAGERETGATVHLVTPEVDGGPILWQSRIPVGPGDTVESLRARLHPVEVEALASTLGRLAAEPALLPLRPPVRRLDELG